MQNGKRVWFPCWKNGRNKKLKWRQTFNFDAGDLIRHLWDCWVWWFLNTVHEWDHKFWIWVIVLVAGWTFMTRLLQQLPGVKSCSIVIFMSFYPLQSPDEVSLRMDWTIVTLQQSWWDSLVRDFFFCWFSSDLAVNFSQWSDPKQDPWKLLLKVFMSKSHVWIWRILWEISAIDRPLLDVTSTGGVTS